MGRTGGGDAHDGVSDWKWWRQAVVDGDKEVLEAAGEDNKTGKVRETEMTQFIGEKKISREDSGSS